MKVFIHDIPLTITPLTNVMDPSQFKQVLRPEQHAVAKAHLQGDVLVLQPASDLVALLLERMKENKYQELENLTLAVENYLEVVEFLKGQFTLVEAAGGVVEKENKVLMIFRLGKWDLPKGKLEGKESPEEGSVREVEEECGIEAELVSPIVATWHTYFRNEKWMLKKTYWFQMACVEDENMEPQYEEDIEQVVWLSRSETEEVLINSYNSIRYVMQEYYRQFMPSL
ncbi:MAG: NUDIX domain-containing protein [Bacteroidota bacterium]